MRYQMLLNQFAQAHVGRGINHTLDLHDAAIVRDPACACLNAHAWPSRSGTCQAAKCPTKHDKLKWGRVNWLHRVANDRLCAIDERCLAEDQPKLLPANGRDLPTLHINQPIGAAPDTERASTDAAAPEQPPEQEYKR